MAVDEAQFAGGDASAEPLSDAELIAATRAGDAGAFAVLYTRHVDAARACARRLVRSRSEADDLVAEGFAKVLGALRRGKGPDLAFRPYLLTSVRNALYDRTRRDSKIEFTDEPPESVNATLLSADYEREERAMVAAAYAALPERWQLVLWHTDVEGRQPAEVAPLLGISANSVAALAYRAREGLRQAYLQAHVNQGIKEDCRGTAEKLSAFVRDGLSARDRRGVEEHLAGCEKCTALLAELQEANRSLKVVLIPVLAGIPAAAYLSGLSGGGIVKAVRRNPGPAAAGAVVAAAAIVFAAVAIRAPGSGSTADALTVPPVGSGRPTTTTTTTTTTPPPTTAVTIPPTVAPTTLPFTPPAFDTAVPPVTVVPYNPNATTATTVRRTTTTTKAPAATTTTMTPATTTTVPGQAATTTTTTTTTTTVPATQAPPAAPALTSVIDGIGPVYSGQNAYFRVRVNNAATGNGGSARKVAVGPADGVVVTFTLPAGVSFTGSTSPDWQCEVTGSTVRCLLPRVEPGAASESMFSVDVAAGQTGSLTISPEIKVNGARIVAPSTDRAIVDGAAIADFAVVPGGSLVVAGNTSSTCTVGLPTSDQCDTARVPLNSSDATVNLADRPVQKAYLVWQGQGDPTASVQLTTPNGATSTIAAALPPRRAGANFVAVADVTDVVRATGSGAYAVSGVQAGTDRNSYGGWALVVVTDDGSGTLRGFTLGLPLVPVDGKTLPVPVSGLVPLGAERNVAVVVVAGEGDRQGPVPPDTSLTTGEHLTLNRTTLATDRHPDDNVFRASVLGLPEDPITFGTDIDIFQSKVAGTDPSLTLTATTGGDGVVLSAVGLLFDL